MRPRALPVPLLLVVLLLAPPAGASVLGLRPMPADPPARFAGEDVEILLQRASALEARLTAMEGEELFEARLELVELYAATSMPKHRATALELCEDLRRRHEDRLEPLLLEAQIQGAMLQLASAIRLLHGEEDRFFSEPELLYAVGYYYFQSGLP